jgi:hypothetical protein
MIDERHPFNLDGHRGFIGRFGLLKLVTERLPQGARAIRSDRRN